ncbi:hypothetical protein GCK72_008845 [Caenorhabditis remanei]|uniref:Uncharacterized protein n=1 Tax=Caenorhabditis remanei TaxID=31234 RepID=A0A6A5H1D0_CAERE|nr:hypothetical protein GCK72_008845 [Caenorhabditis remanei]KAF1760596.1 hypothetical protein GCK72_008845 [Caenorhabditis remanei]
MRPWNAIHVPVCKICPWDIHNREECTEHYEENEKERARLEHIEEIEEIRYVITFEDWRNALWGGPLAVPKEESKTKKKFGKIWGKIKTKCRKIINKLFHVFRYLLVTVETRLLLC